MRSPRPSAAALLLLLALAPAGTGALAAAPERRKAVDLIAPIRPADLLEGRAKEAWIWRHDVLLTEDGEAWIPDPVALRDREFKDALGRRALKVTAATLPEEEETVLVVHLPPPSGPADQWFLRPRVASPAAVRVHAVRFRFRSGLGAFLPEEHRLRPWGSVSDLALEDPKPRWISIDDLVPDGESLFARNSAAVFAAAFSDEFGAAARIHRTRKGLELVSDEVTWGWILPAPSVLKDFSALSEIAAWREGGKPSDAVPARLRRSWFNGRTTERRWGPNVRPGETVYASAGEIYVFRRGETREARINAFPWARASREPFTDQFGEALAFHAPTFNRDMGGWSWVTNSPWLVAEWPAFIEAGAPVDAFPQVPQK